MSRQPAWFRARPSTAKRTVAIGDARGLRAIQVWLAVSMLTGVAAGQSHWQMTPYRIRVAVAAAPAPELDETTMADIIAGLVEGADATVGGAWDLDVEEAAVGLRAAIMHGMATLPGDLFAEEWNSLDKVIVVGIGAVPGGFQLAVRDFDCRTRVWSPPWMRTVCQRALLPSAVFRAVLAAFAPLARIEFDRNQQVVLQPRAGGLPLRDPEFRFIETGAVFLPVVRRNDREGNARAEGIQTVPWTYLRVDKVDVSGISCSLHSGLRRPLRVRVRGRTEQLALAIQVAPAPTRLQLRHRAQDDWPLVGYDVYSRDFGASTTRWLGRTDQAGTIIIEPGDGPLRILYVKTGTSLLARLPIVPGWKPVVTAHLPDDDIRVRAEGTVTALQDNLLDLVARRAILIARVRHEMARGSLDAAKKGLDELQQLPNRESFLQSVAQAAQRDVASDPQVTARIGRLFDTTRKLLGDHLDPREISQLQSEYDRLANDK